MADKEETFYAIYRFGYTIYGVGKTKEEAIENAKKWVDNPDTLEEELKDQPAVGEMTVVEISYAVKTEVEEIDGDIAIEKDEDGIYRLPRESEEDSTLPDDIKETFEMAATEEGLEKLEELGKGTVLRSKADIDHYLQHVVPKIKEKLDKERKNPPKEEPSLPRVSVTYNLRVNKKEAVEAYIHQEIMEKKKYRQRNDYC